MLCRRHMLLLSIILNLNRATSMATLRCIGIFLLERMFHLSGHSAKAVAYQNIGTPREVLHIPTSNWSTKVKNFTNFFEWFTNARVPKTIIISCKFLPCCFKLCITAEIYAVFDCQGQHFKGIWSSTIL